MSTQASGGIGNDDRSIHCVERAMFKATMSDCRFHRHLAGLDSASKLAYTWGITGTRRFYSWCTDEIASLLKQT